MKAQWDLDAQRTQSVAGPWRAIISLLWTEPWEGASEPEDAHASRRRRPRRKASRTRSVQVVAIRRALGRVLINRDWQAAVGQCPLCPQKPAKADISALCQKRTFGHSPRYNEVILQPPPYSEVNARSSSRAASLNSLSGSIPAPLFINSCSSRIVLFGAK